MKRFSFVGMFVGFVFVALFLFFLKSIESRPVTREKKKLTYQQLEEHTVYWAIDQIEQLRDAIDRVNDDHSISEKHRDLIFSGMADQLNDLCGLLGPLRHEEQNIVMWAREFITAHRLPDDLEN